MSRETLKSFLQPYGVDSLKPAHRKSASPGSKIKIDGGEDIKFSPPLEKKLLDLDDASPEGLLGDYLNFIVENSSNIFKINDGIQKSASTNRGDSLAPGNQGAIKVFTDSVDDAVEFSRYSNSQFSDLSKIINKTASVSGEGENGHDILASINELDTESVVLNSVTSDILSKSRFGNIPNKDVFKEENENADQFEQKENFKINRSFGKYYDTDALIKLEQLKKLGASMLLKSSGFDDSLTPGTSLDPGEGIGATVTKLNNPESVITTDTLRSKNAFGFPTSNGLDDSIRDGRGYILNRDNRETLGNTYNTELHFKGENYRLVKLQAALSLVAVRSLAKSLYDTVLKEYDTSGDLSHDVSQVVSDLSYGSSLVSPALGSSRSMLNLSIDYVVANLITPTKYPFLACFKRGLKILFDDDLSLENIVSPNVDSDIIKKYKSSVGLNHSPGFWLAISRSVINSSKNIIANTAILADARADDADFIDNFISVIDSSNVLGFINAIATVGDASYQAYSGENVSENNFYIRPRNVDSLPDGPGTRVGKSKKDDGLRQNQLAWSQNDVPSAYILPMNLIRAAGRLDKTVSGPNPFTAMIGSELVENTYFSKNMDGSSNRIPKEVVQTLENQLDAEYVPFYIQDLRTNEIISFHAFLDSLSDTINPDFSSYSGYGRLDPVKIYNGTTRTVNVGFTIVATSKEDFNSMWYKINKFVTLLYPQWTKGTLVGKDLGLGSVSKFVQPNTQVLGASPLVRLRIGDIIKSNYSKFNLARLFGIGDGDVAPLAASPSVVQNFVRENMQDLSNKIKDISASIIALVYGSPIQLFNLAPVKSKVESSFSASKALSALSSTATNYLKNGFVNPLTLGLVLNRIKNPNVDKANEPSYTSFDSTSKGQELGSTIASALRGDKAGGHSDKFPLYLRGNNIDGYTIIGVDGQDESLIGKKLLIQKPIKVKINSETILNERFYYDVEIVDFSMPVETANLKLRVDPAYLYQTPNETLVNTLEFGILLAGAGGLVGAGIDLGLRTNAVKGFSNATGISPLIDFARTLYQSEESRFMESFENHFVKAYESSMGRGLAGTIGSVTFDWLSDFPWEIDYNSRAPIGCKISFNFDVIHDIPPGLDHTGYNRAPLYNVGDIMKNISDDVYESFYKADEFEFRKQAGKSTKITGKK